MPLCLVDSRPEKSTLLRLIPCDGRDRKLIKFCSGEEIDYNIGHHSSFSNYITRVWKANESTQGKLRKSSCLSFLVRGEGRRSN